MAFKLSKPMQTTLIVAGIAVAAYLIWKWYQSNQSSSDSGTSTSGEGTNLNSTLPEITAGGSGDSGLDYMAGSTNITVEQPVAGAVTTSSGGANPVSGSGGGKLTGVTPGDHLPPGTRPNPIGVTDVKVPDVTGMGFGEAFNMLTKAGFKVTPGAGKANSRYKVSAQSVRAGTSLAKGSTIKLTVKP